MNRATSSPRSRRTTSSERAELLRAFDRSGLSAVAFARKHQIHYTTFCGWRQRHEEAAGSRGSPKFVEVDLLSSPSVSSTALIVDVGAKIRVRISSADQVPLAVAVLARLAKEEAC